MPEKLWLKSGILSLVKADLLGRYDLSPLLLVTMSGTLPLSISFTGYFFLFPPLPPNISTRQGDPVKLQILWIYS